MVVLFAPEEVQIEDKLTEGVEARCRASDGCRRHEIL